MDERSSHEFIYNWKIKNYNVGAERGLAIFSPSFKVGMLNDSEWKLWIHPTNTSQNIDCQLLQLSDILLVQTDVAIQYTIKCPNGAILTSTKMLTETVTKRITTKLRRLIGYEYLKRKMSTWTDETLVICCQMKKTTDNLASKQKELSFIGCEAVTEFYEEEFSFTFPVKFSDSDGWSLNKKVNNNCFLNEIFLKYVDGAVQIELFSNTEDQLRHFLDCSITLLNETGSSIKGETKFKDFDKNNKALLFPSFIDKQSVVNKVMKLKLDILPRYSENFCYCNGTIGKITKMTGSKSVLTNIEADTVGEDVTILQRDFRNMFSDKIYTDVELRVSSEHFPAHKSVLAARSPVFLTMFDQDMAESNTGVVDIPDVEVNIMKLFLEYMYTGFVDRLNVEIALSLMFVADKYQVLTLIEKCSSFLKTVLSSNNVLHVLLVADMVNQEQLKATAEEYIVDNSTEILSLPEWPQWTKLNTTLASEVLLKLSKKFDVAFKNDKV